MSYVVNTSTVEIYRGQNYSGSVPITVCDVTAALAPEDSFVEPESLLGYREALRARHSGVGGRNQHHPPARPHATLDQFPFRRTDRGVRGLPRHRRASQKLRLEILHRDRLMVGDNAPRPHPCGVRVLSGRFFMYSCDLPPRSDVSLRRRGRTRPLPPRHHPLRLCQLARTPTSVPAISKVVGGVGGRRGCGDPPVDTDRSCRAGQRLHDAADHERGVPVPKRVPVDPHAGGLRRQLSRPNDRNIHPTGKSQSTVADSEAASGVLQRRQRLLPRLDGWAPATLDLVGVVERGGVGAQRLLLSDLRAIAQPRRRGASSCEQLRELAKRGLASATLLMDGFVPQKPAAMPLAEQCAFRVRARAQAVGIAHGLDHTFDYTQAL